MSGHSKWHNIQGRKNAQDAKRGKIFQKISRDLYQAAKTGDPDPANGSYVPVFFVHFLFHHLFPRQIPLMSVRLFSGFPVRRQCLVWGFSCSVKLSFSLLIL